MRCRVRMFANGILAHRTSGGLQDPWGTGAASFKRLLGDDAIVVGMTANPEPQQTIWSIHRQRTVVDPDAYRMEPAHTLEMQRRMTGIRLEKLKLLVGKVARGLWQ